MRTIRFLFVSLGLILFTARAQAGLLLEPYIGYEAGTAQYSGLGTDLKYNVTGMVLGGRVGIAVPLLFAALDYSVVSGGKAKGDSGTTVDIDYDRSNLFAVAGVRLPLIRVYGGYGIISDLTFKNPEGEETLKGTALKFGASFTGLPFIAINAEYIMSSFTKLKTASGESTIGPGEVMTDAKANSVLLSVSLPFNI